MHVCHCVSQIYLSQQETLNSQCRDGHSLLCPWIQFSINFNTYAAGFVTNVKYYLITLLRNSEDEKSPYLIERIQLGGNPNVAQPSHYK